METDTHTYIANGYAMHNCNRFLADHLDGYRRNLIRKISQQRFDMLEWQHHQTCQYSDFELKGLIKHYQVKVKELRQEKGL